MENLDLKSVINGELGYSIDLKLTEDELETIKKMIRMQWLYRLQLLVPTKISLFDEKGMESYHELANLIDHTDAWPKTARVLPREAVPVIKKMPFYKKIENEFGDICIADEERLGWENIYWRIVRPGNQDYGSLHTENWFVKLGYYGSEISKINYERIKIWISICSTPGKNGLIVVPRSHLKKDWKWHAEEKFGKPKPIIDEDISKLDVQLLPTEPGRAVIFNYDLLHGGAENLANSTRISIESTFLVPKLN